MVSRTISTAAFLGIWHSHSRRRCDANLHQLTSAFVFTELAFCHQFLHKWLQDGMGITAGGCQVHLTVGAWCRKNAPNVIVWVSVQRNFAAQTFSTHRRSLCTLYVQKSSCLISCVILADNFSCPFYEQGGAGWRKGPMSQSKWCKWGIEAA